MSSGRDDKVDLSRRAFLRGRPAEAVPLGPMPPCIAGGNPAPNPCLDCTGQPCIASCEPDVIRIHPPGHPLPGRAYLLFERAGCTFCGDCYEVCPVAESPAPDRPVPVGLAVLSRETCIAWDGVICISCKTACGWNAITMDGKGRPAVESQACTGCGFCVPVCPTDAIDISH